MNIAPFRQRFPRLRVFRSDPFRPASLIVARPRPAVSTFGWPVRTKPLARAQDRAITDVVACRKSEVRAAFETVLLISYAGKEPAKIHLSALLDGLVFLGCHSYGDAGKIRQSTDVVPMRMGQKNGTQRFLVVASSPQLVGDGPHRL